MAKGEWDQSEIQYLKAAESPSVDERIKAREGLVALYQKLRMFKKAARAKEKLDTELKFLESLVPEAGFYYNVYAVQKGDSYPKLSKEQGVSEEWLRRANGNKPLIAGREIRMPGFPYVLVVDKSEKKLLWTRDGETLKSYPVSIGREETDTPEGEFTIVNKVVNPIWYRLNQQYPPDSPENLLGSRWMGLNVKGYGIHGTKRPGNIGKAVSHGCVRMLNKDVEELFQWVPVGTKVMIKGDGARSGESEEIIGS
ncbi:MAG TPA: L,D-transpeptidase family protein [Candidatus Omnitrophota bacterium]|nr:L,D-transpeptidase family protein [Candidatus Omnitrophota bacterium]